MPTREYAKVPLIVIASQKEAAGLIPRLALKRDPGFEFACRDREPKIGFYRGATCNLAITGVLEHHMVAATALVLARLGGEIPFVLNYGAVGCYRSLSDSDGPKIGETVFIHKVCRFDVDDNVHWVPAVNLAVPPTGLRSVVCVTGSRYSNAKDHKSLFFPSDGQVEDMELYSLAVLLSVFRTPLIALKFVVNFLPSDGPGEARQHHTATRCSADDAFFEAFEKCMDGNWLKALNSPAHQERNEV